MSDEAEVVMDSRPGQVVKRFYGRYGRFIVYLVNTTAVRLQSLTMDEIGHFATSVRFPEDIPQDEVWIDDRLPPKEIAFFLADALAQLKARDQGKTPKQAVAIGVRAEATERAKVDHYPEVRRKPDMPNAREGIKVRKYADIDGGRVHVYMVDGEKVRDLYRTKFHEGGHGYVYWWIPKDEIWIENDIDPAELPYTLTHEYVERTLMKDDHRSYDAAHDIASKVDFMMRSNGETIQPEQMLPDFARKKIAEALKTPLARNVIHFAATEASPEPKADDASADAWFRRYIGVGEPGLEGMLNSRIKAWIADAQVRRDSDLPTDGRAGVTRHTGNGPVVNWPPGDAGVALHELGHALLRPHPTDGKYLEHLPLVDYQQKIVRAARSEYSAWLDKHPETALKLDLSNSDELWADVFAAYAQPGHNLLLMLAMPKTYAAMMKLFGQIHGAMLGSLSVPTIDYIKHTAVNGFVTKLDELKGFGLNPRMGADIGTTLWPTRPVPVQDYRYGLLQVDDIMKRAAMAAFAVPNIEPWIANWETWTPADGGGDLVYQTEQWGKRAAQTFGIAPPGFVFHKLIYLGGPVGYLENNIAHILNAHIQRTPDLKFQVSPGITKAMHTACHEVMHRVAQLYPEISADALDGIRKAGFQVSPYAYWGGDEEALMETGAAFIHSPAQLKQFNSKLYDVAEEWRRRVLATNPTRAYVVSNEPKLAGGTVLDVANGRAKYGTIIRGDLDMAAAQRLGLRLAKSQDRLYFARTDEDLADAIGCNIAALAEFGFNPDQSRIPAGQPGGGRWMSDAHSWIGDVRAKLSKYINEKSITIARETQEARDEAVRKLATPDIPSLLQHLKSDSAAADTTHKLASKSDPSRDVYANEAKLEKLRDKISQWLRDNKDWQGDTDKRAKAVDMSTDFIRQFEELEQQSRSARSEAQATLAASKPVHMEYQVGGVPSGTIDSTIREATDWVRSVTNSTTHPLLLDFKVKTNAREGSELPVNGRTTVYVNPQARASNVVHEIGHALETQNPDIAKAARAFLCHRVGKDAPFVSLQEKYPEDGFSYNEFGRSDGFGKSMPEKQALYVGKLMVGRDDTEIVSMGLERMFRDPASFAKQDPEYAQFIVGILHGGARLK